MSNSRTKFALLNMIFNFSYQIINTLVNIIIPPLIISKFGSLANGLISTIKQILNYVQLIGAGISESTVVSLYKPIAENDEKKISSIYNACSITFRKAGVIFSVASVVIAFIYPFFIKEKINYPYTIILILILSVAGVSEFFVIGRCRSLLMADQKFYIVNIAQIIGAVGNLGITILLIYLDANILIVQFSASSVYMMRIFILQWYVKRNYKFINKKIEPDFQAISRRKAATVHQLSGLISFGSQTIFVSAVCGLAEASVYSVYNLVFTGINTVLSTVSSSLLASFGNLIASDDKKKVEKIYCNYELLYYILMFGLYTVTYIMFLSFIKLYTSNVKDINYYRPEYAFLFCIMGIINCLRTPGATLINAIGHYQETQNRAIIEMTICFILECILVKRYGGVGILIATIVAYFYRSIDVIFYSNKKILKCCVGRSFKIIFLNIVLFMGAVLLNIKIQISATSFVQWAFMATLVVAIVFSIFICFNFVLFRQQFEMILKKIKSR